MSRKLTDVITSNVLKKRKAVRIVDFIPSPAPEPAPAPAPVPVASSPRLFLAEYYELRTYLGDLGRSKVIGNYPLLPGEEQEFYVVSRRSREDSRTVTSSIAETSDRKTVDDLNTSIKEDNATSHAAEKYDYHMDASFRGEAGWSPLSADAEADLNVRGGSNSVRDEFKQSVSSSVDKQVTNTEEYRTQRMSASGEEVRNLSEEETVTKRRIKNADPHKTANYIFYQLAQEYVSLLSLVDVKIGFGDGVPEHNRLYPLSRLDALLQEVLAGPEECAKVRKVVLGELQTIFDYQGTPRSVLKEQALIGDDGSASSNSYWQFDTAVTSSYALLDTEGNVRRKLVVPGVIIKDDRRVLPTTNVAVSILYEG